ncbi:MAG: hypothetical protein H8D80_02670 [Proteobacteria bacterium]|nr:hypothetical protein [Pseudomonadota bacterium]
MSMKIDRHNKWTKEELDIIKENGRMKTTKELSKLLPSRSEGSIIAKKGQLGVTLSSSVRGRLSSTLVYGVGVNDLADDPNYVSKIYDSSIGKIIWRCPFYSKWTGILRRCYCEKERYKSPSYAGCTVTKEWHKFSKFKQWMENQDWEDKHIDKDIIVPNNKVYGPEFCLFVSQRINNLLHTNDKNRGKYPMGVCWHKGYGKFDAKLSINNKTKCLGFFDTAEEASQIYNRARSEYIVEWANNLTSEDTSDVEVTREGLIRHAGLLLG